MRTDLIRSWPVADLTLAARRGVISRGPLWLKIVEGTPL